MTHVIIVPGEDPISIEDARERLAKRGDREPYTPELFEAMIGTRQERDYISTTSLTTKCMRQNSIQRLYPYAEEMSKMWASFRGTMFHGQLEKNVTPGAIEEPRFHVDLDIDGEKLHLSGSPDLVDPNVGILYDYKFTKEAPRFGPWKEHVAQCNINRWLCDHAEYMEWRGERWTPDEKDPRYFRRDANKKDKVLVRPMDWQGLTIVYMDDKGVTPYLATKSIQVPKASGEGTKAARVADVWDDQTVEDIIYGKYPEAHDALTLGNIPPAPEGWEYQSHVLCQYCPVRRTCAELERGGC